MRQFAGFGTPAETNERFRLLLERGQTGLSVAFDMPTLMGFDSDDPRSRGRGGSLRCGRRLDRRRRDPLLRHPAGRRERVHDDQRAGAVAVRVLPGGGRTPGRRLGGAGGHAPDRHLQGVHGPEGVAVPAAAAPSADRRPARVLRGAGAEVPPDQRERLPHPRGGLDRRAGARVHARRRVRLRRARRPARASTCNAFAPQLSFFFDAHIDFFEEIAKFRAARRIWARWLRDRYGATDAASQRLRFHAQTAGVSLTAQQPMNNVIRTAIEALAAVLGGTQSLHTNALDEVLALPTEQAATLALRTQQVIAYESAVADVVDPLGGAYFVEALTDRIEAAGRGDLRPPRRAGPRLDARGRPDRGRVRLVRAGDRRGRVRRTAAVRGRRPGPGGGERVHGGRRPAARGPRDPDGDRGRAARGGRDHAERTGPGRRRLEPSRRWRRRPAIAMPT